MPLLASHAGVYPEARHRLREPADRGNTISPRWRPARCIASNRLHQPAADAARRTETVRNALNRIFCDDHHISAQMDGDRSSNFADS